MERDPATKHVTHMENDEQELYLLYRQQLARGGLSRDQLPYTDQFDDLRVQFNSTTDSDLDHHAVWQLLARVSKVGDAHIEPYFRHLGIALPPKPHTHSGGGFEADDADVDADDHSEPSTTPSPPPTPPSGS